MVKPTSTGSRKSRLRLATVLAAVAVGVVAALAGGAFAQVSTDQADYSPGSVVTISGGNDSSGAPGYVQGNTVDVSATNTDTGWTGSCPTTTITASDGSWSCQLTLSSDPSLAGGSYTYVATSIAQDGSTISESGTFTDSTTSTTTSLTLTPGGPIIYGEDTVLSGTLSGGASLSSKTIDLSIWSATGCTGTSGTTGLSATSATTASGGGDSHAWPDSGTITYTPQAVGDSWVQAAFAAFGSFLGSSDCKSLETDAAPTDTSITNTPATTLALGLPLSVAYNVESAYGVNPNHAQGTVHVNETDVNGTLGCSAGDSIDVQQSSADGTGAADAGFSATGTLNCTPTAAGIYTYNVGFVDSDGNYQNSNSSPDQNLDVTQTVQVCPAAPAVGAAYMISQGAPRQGSKLWRTIITDLASKTGVNGAFSAANYNDVGVCDPGYAAAVQSYISTTYHI